MLTRGLFGLKSISIDLVLNRDPEEDNTYHIYITVETAIIYHYEVCELYKRGELVGDYSTIFH